MISDKLFNPPVRSIGAKVELYEGSTLADTYTQYYALKDFTIERMGESKFFGFGICQKLNVHLIDKDRYIHITTADNFKPYLSIGGEYVNTFPNFYVTETHRDENTNELSVTAYDALYNASKHTVSELDITFPATIGDYVRSITQLLGLEFIVLGGVTLALSFENGANFDGTETIREALNAIAEATQSIYFINHNNKLVFKRLDVTGAAVFNIDKSNYFTLESGTNRRLSAICHATELGDNVIASLDVSGTTQYVRDNPFWDLREDIGEVVDNALAAVGGLTINQFSCSWRGNPLIELGDKISLVTKDNNTVISYLLNDTLEYNGGLSQVTEWKYEDADTETAANPTSLGDALKQTYARVDKANRQIDLVASEVTQNAQDIAALQINTEGITATVSSIQDGFTNAFENVNDELAVIASQVEAKMSAEDLTIQIQQALENGVDKVMTTTGFSFDSTGLLISKSGSEMETQITENGMYIYRNGDVILVVNNEGVNAVNLHATTYLIVGENSRFEDYGTNRTGCFWIGG